MADSAASSAQAGFTLPSNAPQGAAPIQLYSLATPNGQKVSIMLEELGLSYDAHLVDITKNVQFEEWFKAVNPNSKIPAIVDKEGPEGKPIAIFESAAILIYLAEKTGKFLPRHGSARYSVLQWLEWQMGGVGPMFGQTNHFFVYAPEQVPYAQKRYLTESKRILAVLDKQLTLHQYSAGPDYSIADMAIYPWVRSFFKMHGERLEGAKYPHVDRWLEELGDRPAVKRGIHVCERPQA
jgi:GST-like protein